MIKNMPFYNSSHPLNIYLERQSLQGEHGQTYPTNFTILASRSQEVQKVSGVLYGLNPPPLDVCSNKNAVTGLVSASSF